MGNDDLQLALIALIYAIAYIAMLVHVKRKGRGNGRS